MTSFVTVARQLREISQVLLGPAGRLDGAAHMSRLRSSRELAVRLAGGDGQMLAGAQLHELDPDRAEVESFVDRWHGGRIAARRPRRIGRIAYISAPAGTSPFSIANTAAPARVRRLILS